MWLLFLCLLLVLFWKLLVCCSLVVKASATSIWVSLEHRKTELETVLWFCPAWKRVPPWAKGESNGSRSHSESPCAAPVPSCLWSLPARRSSQAGGDHVGGVPEHLCKWLLGLAVLTEGTIQSFYSIATRSVHLLPLWAVSVTVILPDPQVLCMQEGSKYVLNA